jgi:N-dimethylarginine dimethylaminohydrolase
MTLLVPGSSASRPAPAGQAVRRFVLCPPRYFGVHYSINPWMQPARGADPAEALRQWQSVRDTLAGLGHQVDEITPVPGLPDLVFAANAGLVIGGRALVSRFRHAERRGEEAVFTDWFRTQGFEVTQAGTWNEGEGDYLVTGDTILAGTGFRSATDSYREVAEHFGRPLVPLTLVDPRFYHLDTALAVLHRDPDVIAYWPGAFSDASRAMLARHFPDAVLATEADAMAFGLNACSDGQHVVLAAGATALADRLAERGFEPHLVDTSELQKAGGSAKCCILEIHP